jgi:hypothetical protein
VRRARPVRRVIAERFGPVIVSAFSASRFDRRRDSSRVSGLGVAVGRLRCEHQSASNNKLQRSRGAASERADGSGRKDKVLSLCGIHAALR